MATGLRSDEGSRDMDGIVIDEEDLWDGDSVKDSLWNYPDSLVTRSCLNELLDCFSSESYKTSNQEKTVILSIDTIRIPLICLCVWNC